MKQIKVGDFVWHEKYGKGMNLSINGGSYKIQFEGCLYHRYIDFNKRKSLFVKGDLVVGTSPLNKMEVRKNEQSGTFTMV